MRIIDSARKHGISDNAIQAASWPAWVEPLDEKGEQWRELRLGFDTKARLLEMVVVCASDGDEVLIHAMKARPKYIDLLP
ncbi:toxin [Actinomyces faecalis]|uniref:toxin n=1 Tax=Actinomyces faecalis TaxID=2722820 RepID=UPI001557D42A|nr:toxin [Actinomyces faecalis]